MGLCGLWKLWSFVAVFVMTLRCVCVQIQLVNHVLGKLTEKVTVVFVTDSKKSLVRSSDGQIQIMISLKSLLNHVPISGKQLCHV